jgi:phage virion morphogenesis protein
MARRTRVQVDGRATLALLDALGSQLRSRTAAHEAVASTLLRRIHTRFDTKRDPDGRSWVPWAPATAEMRAAEGRGTLLQYTGRMRASLSARADSKGVYVGFGVPYAKYHETGTRRMPARPVLGAKSLSRGDALAVYAAVRRTFERAASKRGGAR